MKNGTLFTRIIARKLQTSQAAEQFILLAGFDSKLVQATAAFYETLEPVSTITQRSIDAVLSTLQQQSSSYEMCDVTKSDVLKKLNKCFERNTYNY